MTNKIKLTKQQIINIIILLSVLIEITQSTTIKNRTKRTYKELKELIL